ncbi:MAG TPA: flavin reductase family protein [Chloroflexia bacterium]|nr:flavin reductase family protein [Chloroflexia bacterium]
MSFTPHDFRKTLSHFATGITVVTTTTPDGGYYGITVNSITSVSLNPPLVLICIDKKTEAHRLLPLSGVFCANILEAQQQYLSDRFAGREPDNKTPFADIALHTEATGAPVFNESLGFVDCRIVNAYDGGDHTIFLGEVVQLGYRQGETEPAPLLYYRSNYRTMLG